MSATPATATFGRPRYEDLRVGDAIRTSGRTVTEADLVAFGTLTGDLHPQHMDESWAASRHFGTRVAHGMLVVSYTMGLLSPFIPEQTAALRSIRTLRFKRPVRVGDTIRAEVSVAGVNERDDGSSALTDLDFVVRNQRDERVVHGSMSFIWLREAA